MCPKTKGRSSHPCILTHYAPPAPPRARPQREKKTLKPIVENGKLMMLTSHTLAPVPLAIGGAGLPDGVALREDMPNAGLANVAATIINLMGYEAPKHMQPTLLAA